MMLTEEELPLDAVMDCRIFHFGTLSMTHEGVRKATCKAIDLAKKNGALISFGPNLRPPLWSDLEEARVQIEYVLARCDILKIAGNELEFMTGETDFDKGAAILRKKYPSIRLFNVTAGADGGEFEGGHPLHAGAGGCDGAFVNTQAKELIASCSQLFGLSKK